MTPKCKEKVVADALCRESLFRPLVSSLKGEELVRRALLCERPFDSGPSFGHVKVPEHSDLVRSYG